MTVLRGLMGGPRYDLGAVNSVTILVSGRAASGRKRRAPIVMHGMGQIGSLWWLEVAQLR